MTTTLVTGGAGYIGAPLSARLLAAGDEVRVLDALLFGQDAVADALERDGVEVLRGDIRDPATRAAALHGVDAVVHLAAIVGDPACARDPALAAAVNVDAANALIDDARAAGVARFVMASTCSNYGRTDDTAAPVDEDRVLAPLSLYARQKVVVEQRLLRESHAPMVPTCLRFATIYGVAPRMRFDLTVNEFTRDLWDGRELEVFGAQFWRPYVHVEDAGRAVAMVLGANPVLTSHRVYNVGLSSENHRKQDLVAAIREQTSSGTVSFVARDEDPRDYKVSFERIGAELGFRPQRTVDDGIAELLAGLDAGAFGDPFDGRHRNTP